MTTGTNYVVSQPVTYTTGAISGSGVGGYTTGGYTTGGYTTGGYTTGGYTTGGYTTGGYTLTGPTVVGNTGTTTYVTSGSGVQRNGPVGYYWLMFYKIIASKLIIN